MNRIFRNGIKYTNISSSVLGFFIYSEIEIVFKDMAMTYNLTGGGHRHPSWAIFVT